MTNPLVREQGIVGGGGYVSVDGACGDHNPVATSKRLI